MGTKPMVFYMCSTNCGSNQLSGSSGFQHISDLLEGASCVGVGFYFSGGFKYFWYFHLENFWEMIQFDLRIFFRRVGSLKHQPDDQPHFQLESVQVLRFAPWLQLCSIFLFATWCRGVVPGNAHSSST